MSSYFRVRVGIHWLVTKPLFDVFIMFVILLSSAALAAEDPVQENAPRNKMLSKFDYGFTAIFFIECLLKVGKRLDHIYLIEPSFQLERFLRNPRLDPLKVCKHWKRAEKIGISIKARTRLL